MPERAWIDAFLARERLPHSYRAVIDDICEPLATRIGNAALAQGGTYVVGVCGSQGSGKSTLVAALGILLMEGGARTAVLSIDDLYLTHAERQALGRNVHPLLATRGVPGTHDVALGLETFAKLRAHGPTALPAFDKQVDDRRPRASWPHFPGPAQVILFEGWCLGARPQPAVALDTPVNSLERDEDPQGTWRAYVNDALAGPYRELFAVDQQILLAAPGFEAVYAWRVEQEHKLRARATAEGGDLSRVMNDTQVARFIAHYERITRWVLEEMPARADVLIELDAARRMAPVRGLYS